MDNIDEMANAIKQGIDNNSTDSPALSIDPESKQISVVGDPTQIAPTDGKYTITFIYPADEISEADKQNMKVNPENKDEYLMTVTYVDKRIKPLYRTTISMDVAMLMTKMNVITNDGGYTTDGLGRAAVRVFLDNIELIARIAKNVLGIPEEQIDYLSPESLVEFFTQLLNNEPNLLKEAVGFLEPSTIKQLQEVLRPEETTQAQDTQQS